jgi:dephospho-CoA kinase
MSKTIISLGITGSIGMGKSTISDLFRREGVPVHDADACVHGLLKDVSVKRQIRRVFPVAAYPEMYALGAAMMKRTPKNPDINRAALGKIVFSDGKKRSALEAILHPAVRADQSKFYARHRQAGAKIIGFDVPLLFETDADLAMDVVVNVAAPYHVQRARVLKRPHMDEEKFHSILDKQMPTREKQMRSDYTVHTGIGRGAAARQVKTILAELRERKNAAPANNAQDHIEQIMVQQFQKRSQE